MLKIEIDDNSGFCFGVTTAIKKAEEELSNGGTLYCLGDIVHNSIECDRLKRMGLVTIDHATFCNLHNAKVLLRAHGEPPQTYDIARRNNLEIIDATCPVVLKLQQRIKKMWQETEGEERQIIIHGQAGHAEVLGLVGQTHGEAIVIENAPLGVQAGVAAGIFTIAVNTGPLPDKVLLDAGANLLFHSMQEFNEAWETLKKAF